MYRLTKLIALVAVFGLLFVGGYTYAQDHAMTYRQYSEDHGALSEPRAFNSFSADYLLGHRVWGGGNWELGTISDFIIDQTNGRVALVVLSDVPTYGSRKVAIPFAFLTRDEGGALKAVFPPESPVGFGSAATDFAGMPSGSESVFPYSLALAPGKIKGDHIDSAWVENVYRHYGYAPYWTEDSTAMTLYPCDNLLGSNFHFRNSDAIARADDFIIDPDGHISYVVVSDVPGRNDMVAVPFSLMKGEDQNACVLDIPQDRLASAPSYNASVDFGNRAYAERVYRYYGVQPYWTEDGMMR